MAAAKFHSIVDGKISILVATAAIVALFFSTGSAQEAPLPPSLTPPAPAYAYPPCETLGVPLPECQSWCAKIGFHGGYLKADVCCCNS
ncbi:hypothetical protein U9M48_001389 [Paspalum notatum var. saurae]|uniref:Uncharacterized protein n=1 Tax=Paspalum notatum var. saurae TaxID=547442 RepID=A0AAQ3SGN3_PASNO